nr:hypothetical protein [Escherichia coli]
MIYPCRPDKAFTPHPAIVHRCLMAMGMMMLSPLIVSLPFKLMLFVLIDGWSLTIGTLTTSIRGLGLG